ncbi:hypothetical protein [Vibrio phage 29Fa.3]|nr:hypothetical protein [Vibrio phage 29Fa.3]
MLFAQFMAQCHKHYKKPCALIFNNKQGSN